MPAGETACRRGIFCRKVSFCRPIMPMECIPIIRKIGSYQPPLLKRRYCAEIPGKPEIYHGCYSAAVIRDICREQDIPCQNFANRADVPGGSTLGNISSAHVSIPAADIGLAQLAMHSALKRQEKRIRNIWCVCVRAFSGSCSGLR